ncbi:MAG: hypothetical protein M1819_003052 [Sarea resinae]|nr:MAG: hypothetical protein M1819_003052 [Sarea resinae]
MKASSIEPGDAGIWATCSKGKEGKCVGELKDLFDEYVERLYPGQESEDDGEDEELDIEAEIKKEVEGMKRPRKEALFAHVKLDVQCVVFFKTSKPVEPMSFVHAICQDAFSASRRKRGRWVKRLTPMTLMGRATEKGLEEVAEAVLAPHFHQGEARKFAIRPSLRNHSTLTRDRIIKQVASTVGPGHKVDLKDYEFLILVEVYKSVLGMSVVGPDYEKLKRYNLAEIYEPSATSSIASKPLSKDQRPEDQQQPSVASSTPGSAPPPPSGTPSMPPSCIQDTGLLHGEPESKP